VSTVSLDQDAVLAYLKSLGPRKVSVKAMARELEAPETTFRNLYKKIVAEGLYTPPDPSAPESLEPQEPVLLPDGLPSGNFRLLTLSQLDLDCGTRVRELDERNLRDLEEILEQEKSTSVLPPLRAFYIPDLQRNALTRGFHRYEASARILGPDASWKVELFLGTLRDAIEDAMQDNRRHGLRLSLQDREQIIRRLLTEGHWVGWNDIRIAEAAGERHPRVHGRKFVAKVRRDWQKEQGKKEREEKRRAVRNGQVYDQRVPRGRKDHAQADHLEDQEESTETRTDSDSDRRKAIEEEYLMAIPMRANLHPDLMESFDRTALAWRSTDHPLRTLQNWAITQQAILGPQHPLTVLVGRVVRIPAPISVGIDLEWRHPWFACQACLDAEGKTTGRTPDGEPCPKCSGTGILLKEKRS
jgi:hypothetical protein